MPSATRTSGSTREHLTERQLDQFRASLQQQRMFRTQQLAELTAAAAAQDSVTFCSGSAHDEIADALRAGAEAALSDIDSALRRIMSGAFGTCTACGAAIPTERLEILLTAGLCMQCARVRATAR